MRFIMGCMGREWAWAHTQNGKHSKMTAQWHVLFHFFSFTYSPTMVTMHLLNLWSSTGEHMGQTAPSTWAPELALVMLTAEQEHFLQGCIWRSQTHPGTKEQHQSPARDKS